MTHLILGNVAGRHGVGLKLKVTGNELHLTEGMICAERAALRVHDWR